MTPWAKRIAIALAVSVGVNLLLAGYVFGYGLRRPQTAAIGERNGPAMVMGRGMGLGPGMGMGRGMGNGPGMGSGTGCRRPALRAAIELRGNDLRACRQEIDKARDNVRVVLGHEPLDRAALEQALAALRAQSGRGQELTHQAIVDAAVRATPEQRRELANEFGSGDRER
jgi:hypothetical protein